jgi:hypothetical protein
MAIGAKLESASLGMSLKIQRIYEDILTTRNDGQERC